MPHFKCMACRGHLHVSGSPVAQAGGPCPECGSPLESVVRTDELVGLRSITPAGRGGDDVRPEPRRRIAGRDDEFMMRRAAILERDRFTAERWLDDGDQRRAGAIALPPPETFL